MYPSTNYFGFFNTNKFAFKRIQKNICFDQKVYKKNIEKLCKYIRFYI